MKKTKWFILACLLITVAVSLYGQNFTPFQRNYSDPIKTLGLIMWITSGITFSAVGLFLILFCHVALVLREIAFNTRREAENNPYKQREEYHAIPSIVSILKIIGFIIIAAGWVWPLLSKI
ncbi:MAG: hypothetical protein MUF15_14310 [Acidobacteria bacterium]|jgi:heme/copper-type cytochrome/quinol oxidase subunit 2|nr:hypothetical protein [Acidobacteriota bacterium]